jgi:hypothetical protein
MFICNYFRTIKGNKLLSKREFLKWNLQAIWHSLVAFFFSYGIFVSNTPFASDGKVIKPFILLLL